MAEYTYGKDFAIRTETDCIATENDFGQYVGRITVVKIKTNADRIRQMTDEELAEWLSNVLNENSVSEGLCPQTIEFSRNCYKTDCNDKICIMAWLKKEVDDG